MDWKTVFLSCLVLITHRVCSSELSSPQNLKIRLSVFTWKFSGNDSNVMYTVQYNTSSGAWQTVCDCKHRSFDFSSAAEDFYGKHFRVRAERENQTSAWRVSEQVQCAHNNVCSPQITLKVETDRVLLWVQDRDKSLGEEHGSHLMLRGLYWKTSSPDNIQEHDFGPNPLVLEDLEAGQEYCFQVKYLAFQKPYGKPSRKLCELIPESSGQRTLRIILLGVLTVGGLAMLGCCIYYVYIHYRRIKILLRPPLDIPVHFKEFLFMESYEHPISPSSSHVQESFDFVTVVQEVGQEEGSRDAGESSAPVLR
ncbi:interferon gamma receptor 2 [Trichomycterus rosablanca]|uniref:interferon gamma receptor 2 n=1 Tax=Trichomycterus rosablanca TaxID=2290929 RepID=UPI002F35F094